jgi:hypothetical protein
MSVVQLLKDTGYIRPEEIILTPELINARWKKYQDDHNQITVKEVQKHPPDDSARQKEAAIALFKYKEQEAKLEHDNPWVNPTISEAISRGWIKNDDTRLHVFNWRRDLATWFQLQHHWYMYFHPYVKQWCANEFKKKHPQTRQQLYEKLYANDAEPYQSMNAYFGFSGVGIKTIVGGVVGSVLGPGGTIGGAALAGGLGGGYVPLPPKGDDTRTDFYYETEYPFAGFIIESWWPQYGSDESRHSLADRTVFQARISHLIPNVKLGADKIEKAAEKGADDLSKWWEKNSTNLYVVGVAVLGIGALGASASLVNAIKK